MSDCYHVKDVHTEAVYFFPGSEVCSTFPSLSETLTPAGLWVPPKEKLFGTEVSGAVCPTSVWQNGVSFLSPL